jgi:hypothetical protein
MPVIGDEVKKRANRRVVSLIFLAREKKMK